MFWCPHEKTTLRNFLLKRQFCGIVIIFVIRAQFHTILSLSLCFFLLEKGIKIVREKVSNKISLVLFSNLAIFHQKITISAVELLIITALIMSIALVMSMVWLLPERFPLSENISFGPPLMPLPKIYPLLSCKKKERKNKKESKHLFNSSIRFMHL